MNPPKHTPGPWQALPENTPIRITGAKAEQIAAVYGGFVGETEQLANGRLVAAAPVLLEYVSKLAAGGDAQAQEVMAQVEVAPA